MIIIILTFVTILFVIIFTGFGLVSPAISVAYVKITWISPKEHLSRFGHSMVSPVMRRLNSNLSSIPEGDLSLHQVATIVSISIMKSVLRK